MTKTETAQRRVSSTKASRVGVKIDFDERVKMRDNVELSCAVFRPSGKGRFPVVLQRTPYSSLVFAGPPVSLYETSLIDRANYFAQRGYVFVLQDCRGKNESDGEFYPWIHEAEDGYDTQEW